MVIWINYRAFSVGPLEYRTCLLFISSLYLSIIVYNWVFLRKGVKQKRTDVTSFCIQLEKWGRGLLREAFRSVGECLLCVHKASCSNPHHIFSNCMQNDVTSVHFSLTTFRKNPNCTLVQKSLVFVYRKWLIFFLQLRSFRCASVSWNPDRSCPRPWPPSSCRRSYSTTPDSITSVRHTIDSLTSLWSWWGYKY